MMRNRDKYFQKFKASNSADDLRAFKQFCNRVVNKLRESKRNYYHQYFDENKKNMKMLWKGIKNIVSLIPIGLDRISHLKDSKGSLIKDPEKIANEFNQFFANVASDIT